MLSKFIGGENEYVTLDQINEYYKKESCKPVVYRMESLFYEISNRVSIVVGKKHLEYLYPYFISETHVINEKEKFSKTYSAIIDIENNYRKQVVVLVENDNELCDFLIEKFKNKISIINFGEVLNDFTY